MDRIRGADAGPGRRTAPRSTAPRSTARRRRGGALPWIGGILAAAGATFLLARLLRRTERGWGASLVEAHGILPGDELIALPRYQATRAIGIRAPVHAVWPWLAQLGQGRGGFYSFDALENLFGLGIHSADRIVPELQRIQVGDEVHLADPVALRVAVADPDRALVLHGDGATAPAAAAGRNAIGPAGRGTAGVPAPAPFAFSWAFVLEPDGPDRSRLVVRERYDWDAPSVSAMFAVVEWVSAVMTIRMLHGIKSRAERADGTRRG